MPKEFIITVDGEKVFNSTLCRGHVKNGARCKRKVVIGFEYCFSHLPQEMRLKIKTSTIAGAWSGLFAFDRTKGEDEIVFKAGDTVCEYNGQVITQVKKKERYQGHTAPYAVQYNANRVIDCACKRGVGALANTNRQKGNNATFSINTRSQTIKVKATKNIRNNEEVFIAYGSHSGWQKRVSVMSRRTREQRSRAQGKKPKRANTES